MTGEQVGSVSASGDDGEWRKLLTSAFKDGTQFLAFDNIDEKITVDSPSLAMALTTGWFSDRLLHTNTNVKLKRRCVMVMYGNNLKLGPDILRRTYRVRIDDGNVSASDERRFTHPERVGSAVLVEWLKRNRAKLVGAICTMIRAWYEADCPKWGGHVIESFEEFCRTIGGILQYAGLDDFLRGAIEDLRSMGDDDEAQWGAFLCGIRDWTGETPFTAKSLVAKCKASPELAALIPDKVGTVDSKFLNAYIVGSLLGHRIDTKFRSDGKIVKLTKAAAGGHDKNAWSVHIVSE